MNEKYLAKATPPATALKEIKGGRLKGMTDINPQWRYLALTEIYGLCGFGWKYEIVRVWIEPGADGVIFAFAEINLYVNIDGQWSESIPGSGGSQLVQKERDGLYNNDEAYKMAITDALSVATKMLGIGANIYMGMPATKYASTAPDSELLFKNAVDEAGDCRELSQLETTWKTYEKKLNEDDRKKFAKIINNLKNSLAR
jgi:hypothetical protein